MMTTPQSHRMTLRVYYEDTDLAGIVYYANYFRFIERGRTEFLRAAGVDQMAIRQDLGLVFAVRKVEAEFLRPAVMDDVLTIETEIVRFTGARMTMEQSVLRSDETLFRANVQIVALKDGRATRIPPAVARLLVSP